jgi:hypothetical protein
VNPLDLSKVPFFQFSASLTAISLAYSFVCFMIVKFFPIATQYAEGFYIGIGSQVTFILLKVFFLNKDWQSPPVIQFLLNVLSFFVSLGLLTFFSVFKGNIPFVIGFFIAYYLTIKNIVLIAHLYSRNENNE